jgi:hypothetical protein
VKCLLCACRVQIKLAVESSTLVVRSDNTHIGRVVIFLRGNPVSVPDLQVNIKYKSRTIWQRGNIPECL